MGINSTLLAFEVCFVREIQYPDSYSNIKNFEYASRMLTHIWGPNYSKTPILCSHILCFPGFYARLYFSGQMPMRIMLYFARVYIPDFALYRNLPFIFLLLPTGGLGSVVGISTVYGLDGLEIESRWGGEIFRTCPHWPWGPPSLLYIGYLVFPWG